MNEIKVYEAKNVPVATLNDWELIDLILNCGELFGTSLKESTLPAFKIILSRRFNFVRDKDIFEVCLENSSNPALTSQRFTPQFLAGLIVNKKREELPTYAEKMPTNAEKEAMKREFLNDLYADFEDFCNGYEIRRIFVWGYLATKLHRAGLITKAQMIQADKQKEIYNRGMSNFGKLTKDFEAAHKPICIEVFKNLALQNKHIKNYIN